uniref:PGG domain-containing protein n=1 Tax=Chenopodium quinoa TaxID=63459 RepID=A0A803LRQ2_CHEQI
MKKEIYKAAARGDVEFLKDVEAAAAMYSDDVAAQFGQLDFIKVTLECFPEPSHQRKLICETNSGGDTPLHLAAKQRTQALAEYLVAAHNNLPGSPPSPWRIRFIWRTEMSAIHMINSLNSQGAALSTRNSLFVQENEDISSLSLFQKFLKSRGVDFDNENDIKFDRSTYGVRGEDVKEYMNPMGVVAALLATVTFTAAFTVPGGYKGDTGIPNLGKKAAFQVFMVADVVGMCSSMMVLFCLLWLLSRQDIEEDVFKEDEKQVMLVDMTIKLLLISFYDRNICNHNL